MSALKSLGLALDVATTRRDEAARALGRQFERHRQAQAQLEQLESYAVETTTRWAPGTRQQPSPESIFHYYQFMDRLQQTVALQRKAMADIERDVAAARSVLAQAEVRIASLRQLRDLRLAEIARAQALREQKQTDEFAALAHRRRVAALVPE
jgi:flagellar FliJ protein